MSYHKFSVEPALGLVSLPCPRRLDGLVRRLRPWSLPPRCPHRRLASPAVTGALVLAGLCPHLQGGSKVRSQIGNGIRGRCATKSRLTGNIHRRAGDIIGLWLLNMGHQRRPWFWTWPTDRAHMPITLHLGIVSSAAGRWSHVTRHVALPKPHVRLQQSTTLALAYFAILGGLIAVYGVSLLVQVLVGLLTSMHPASLDHSCVVCLRLAQCCWPAILEHLNNPSHAATACWPSCK